MATTFKRIQTLIQQSNKQKSWNDIDELAEFVREQKLKEFPELSDNVKENK